MRMILLQLRAHNRNIVFFNVMTGLAMSSKAIHFKVASRNAQLTVVLEFVVRMNKSHTTNRE